MVTYEIHCYSGIVLPTNNLVWWQNNTSILIVIMVLCKAVRRYWFIFL